MSSEDIVIWEEYEKKVNDHKREEASKAGSFSCDMESKFHEQCVAVPLPQSVWPLLVLPLTIHLVRSHALGCSEALSALSCETITREMTLFWHQARIDWQLVAVMEADLTGDSCPYPKEAQFEARSTIESQLKRGADGKMMNKNTRADLFLKTILPACASVSSVIGLDPSSDAVSAYGINPFTDTKTNNSLSNSTSLVTAAPAKAAPSLSYHVWFFDCIGMGSQGCCIDRKSRVVIMGERSSKGYPTLTARPHLCLAKTMAHELGHALQLGHPAGRRFRDGTVQIPGSTPGSENARNRNLMEGGSDKKGGGGYRLEPWQICISRTTAVDFLSSSHSAESQLEEKRSDAPPPTSSAS